MTTNPIPIDPVVERAALPVSMLTRQQARWLKNHPDAALQSPVVSEEMIRHLASTVANIRQGESSTPRCEPPGEFEVNLAREWVERVLKALAMSAKADNREGRE